MNSVYNSEERLYPFEVSLTQARTILDKLQSDLKIEAFESLSSIALDGIVYQAIVKTHNFGHPKDHIGPYEKPIVVLEALVLTIDKIFEGINQEQLEKLREKIFQIVQDNSFQQINEMSLNEFSSESNAFPNNIDMISLT